MTLAHRLLLKWARTVHVYVTLFGFVLLLFFAVTGFMLNHENWFLPMQSITGKLPTKWLGDPADRNSIIEVLKNEFGVPNDMVVESFNVHPSSLQLAFKSNEGSANAVIQCVNGDTVVTIDTDGQARERFTIVEGEIPTELLVPDDPTKALPIVEKLRKDFGCAAR